MTETIEPQEPMPKQGEVWKHLVTLGHYKIMGVCRLQVQNADLDNAPCVVYQSVDNMSVWCRPISEFMPRFVQQH